MRRALSVVASLPLLLVSSCDKKETAAAADGAPTEAAAASASASHTVQGRPGCSLAVPGGSLLPKLERGALSIAVTKGRALVVDTAPAGAKAARIMLGPTGAPDGAAEPIDDVAPKGSAALTFAAAVAFDTDLASVAFGYAANAPTSAQCSDGVFVLKRSGPTGARRDLTHACRATTMLRAAARRELGIAILDGPASADAWILDRTTTKHAHLETLGSSSASIAETAAAAGATTLAGAWIVKEGAKRELHVARLSRTGERLGGVEVLDKQNVGSVSMAFEGDTLHVVWSSYRPDKQLYALRWTKWPAGGAPAAAQTIGTGVLSASAPAIAIDGSRFVLAWVEGDEKSAVVRVGSSKNGLAAVSGLANTVSNAGAAASGPVVAVENDAMFIAWTENGATPEVRASAIKCVE